MIHPTAYIDPSAELASDVEVGPMAYIGAGCVLHSGVKIGAKATVECYTEIGEGTMLSPNAHIGGAPQDVSYKGEPTRLKVGKNCIIREFATMHRASTKEDGITVVGDNGFFMAYSHLAHDCKVGDNVIIAGGSQISGHTQVGDYVVISGLVGTHQFSRVGKGAMISALSRSGKDVPPFCTVLNDVIVSLNVVGMRRRGINAETRAEIKRAVNILTDKSLLLNDAREKLGELVQFPEIVEFRNFVNVDSKRGIIRSASWSNNND
ncbi:MAG: acyl-ACP--UDP-N-acetylglucosamine O-acyltransferase [Deferribacteraceae bacterium]|jgi:UDP-N-acetylglucosamine acyltransferase|nr:acyl-ACP--UDP-N-acetylglucosamine O-acyltransferase [Deferribacteraceae bacterium]